MFTRVVELSRLREPHTPPGSVSAMPIIGTWMTPRTKKSLPSMAQKSSSRNVFGLLPGLRSNLASLLVSYPSCQ
jgi:hypothetical protein